MFCRVFPCADNLLFFFFFRKKNDHLWTIFMYLFCLNKVLSYRVTFQTLFVKSHNIYYLQHVIFLKSLRYWKKCFSGFFNMKTSGPTALWRVHKFHWKGVFLWAPYARVSQVFKRVEMSRKFFISVKKGEVLRIMSSTSSLREFLCGSLHFYQ